MTRLIQGMPIQDLHFTLEPMRVLYEFDGSRIFTCAGPEGGHFLAYQCGEDPEASRFLLVPADEGLERQLTTGAVSVRDALSRPGAWFMDVGPDWEVLRAWKVNIADLPVDFLPRPGVLLWPNLGTAPTTNGFPGHERQWPPAGRLS